ncbi:MAG TPA: thiamine phosphate synthase [Candidatus Anoxymicrobiaceae bacterium]
MTGCAIGPNLVWVMKLVVITCGGPDGMRHEDVARAALAGGCRAVQMRDKDMTDREFAEVALRIKGFCRHAHALLFVNDRVDVAAAISSDGVHLGIDDLDVGSARKLMPPGSIIGFSPEDLEQARAAVESGADYLGIGPVFGTMTKPDAGNPIGPEGLMPYVKVGIAPVIAVGGISAGNAVAAFKAGVAGVAVASAVAGASDMEKATRELMMKIEEASG